MGTWNKVERLRPLPKAKANPDMPDVGFCVDRVGACIYACILAAAWNAVFLTLFSILFILITLITIIISMCLVLFSVLANLNKWTLIQTIMTLL
jgi:presenilin-like A22 family membrane protease